MILDKNLITKQMQDQYLAGTLYGFMSCNPSMGILHLQIDQICEELAKSTGKVVTQTQRGVVVWPV